MSPQREDESGPSFPAPERASSYLFMTFSLFFLLFSCLESELGCCCWIDWLDDRELMLLDGALDQTYIYTQEQGREAGGKFTIQDGRIGRATSKHPKYIQYHGVLSSWQQGVH